MGDNIPIVDAFRNNIALLKKQSVSKVVKKSKVIDPFTGEIYSVNEERGKHLQGLIDYCNKCENDTQIMNFKTGKCIDKTNRFARTNKKLKKLIKFCDMNKLQQIPEHKKPLYQRLLNMTVQKDVFGVEFKLKDVLPVQLKKLSSTIKKSKTGLIVKIGKGLMYSILILVFIAVLISNFTALRKPLLEQWARIYATNKMGSFLDIFKIPTLLDSSKWISKWINSNWVTRIALLFGIATERFGRYSNTVARTTRFDHTGINESTVSRNNNQRTIGITNARVIKPIDKYVSNILYQNNLVNNNDGSIKLVNAHINSLHINNINTITQGPSGDIIATVNIQNKLINIPIVTKFSTSIGKQKISDKKKQLLKSYDALHDNINNELQNITLKQEILHLYTINDELKDLYRNANTSSEKNKLQADIEKITKSINNRKRPDMDNMIENTVKLAQYTDIHEKLSEYENEINHATDDQDMSIKPIYETLLTNEYERFKQVSTKKNIVQRHENLQILPASTSNYMNRFKIKETSPSTSGQFPSTSGQFPSTSAASTSTVKNNGNVSQKKRISPSDIINKLITEM